MYAIIVGCSRVGAELARLLADEGHNVTLIDENPESFKRLPPSFNGLTITGSGFDLEVLKNAGAEQADTFCALTDRDNANIVASQVAKKIFKVPKVIARIYDPKRAEIYRSFDIDVISGTVLLAAMIRDKIIESRFSSYLIETGELGVIEVEVKGSLVGKRVGQLNVPGEFLLTSIKKKEGAIIPHSDTTLEENDVLMGLVKTSSLNKIKKLLGSQANKA
jgi:trk system potassium uptake protein TrkA